MNCLNRSESGAFTRLYRSKNTFVPAPQAPELLTDRSIPTSTVVDDIYADDFMAGFEQLFCDVEADETGGTGD